MKTFSHVVEIDEKARKLNIHRLFESGEKQLFTSVDLPVTPSTGDSDAVGEFARRLGENLLFDSPTARKLLGL
jgi:hypothetical protein